jgi:hypothetical protein
MKGPVQVQNQGDAAGDAAMAPISPWECEREAVLPVRLLSFLLDSKARDAIEEFPLFGFGFLRGQQKHPQQVPPPAPPSLAACSMAAWAA